MSTDFYEHLFPDTSVFGKTEKYNAPRGRGRDLPERDRITHANRLLAELQEVQRIAYRTTGITEVFCIFGKNLLILTDLVIRLQPCRDHSESRESRRLKYLKKPNRTMIKELCRLNAACTTAPSQFDHIKKFISFDCGL
jgi:hypothetical protein